MLVFSHVLLHIKGVCVCSLCIYSVLLLVHWIATLEFCSTVLLVGTLVVLVGGGECINFPSGQHWVQHCKLQRKNKLVHFWTQATSSSTPLMHPLLHDVDGWKNKDAAANWRISAHICSYFPLDCSLVYTTESPGGVYSFSLFQRIPSH